MRQVLRRTLVITVMLFATHFLALPLAIAEVSRPNIHGYGLRTCEAFLLSSKGRDDGIEQMIAQYLSYQDWFGGLVTGLSLATDMDVLQGVKVDGALRRIHVYCDDHPTDDFFTASMDLIKMLSKLNQ